MTIPDLAAWLRQNSAEDAALTLHRASVQGLQHELQRLLQSNDRMRKQNSKLRKRVARLKGGDDDVDSHETVDEGGGTG